MNFMTLKLLLLLTFSMGFSLSPISSQENEKVKKLKLPEIVSKSIPWKHDPKEIFSEAVLKKANSKSETKKYVLIDFEAEWCGFCKKLDRETYTDENVIRYFAEHLVALKVDVDKYPQLKLHFKVEGLPTMVLVRFPETDNKKKLSLTDLKEVGRFVGYRDAPEYLKEVRKLTTSDLALREIEKVAQDNPDDPDAQRALARALVADSQLTKAQKVLEKASQNSKFTEAKILEVKMDLALVLTQRKLWPEASELFKTISESEKSPRELRSKAQLSLAICRVSLKELLLAEEALKPLLANVKQTVEEALKKRGAAPPPPKEKKVSPEDMRVLEIVQLEALFLRGYLRAVKGQAKAALDDLRLAEQADPLGKWGSQAGFIVRRLER